MLQIAQEAAYVARDYGRRFISCRDSLPSNQFVSGKYQSDNADAPYLK